MKIIIVGCDKVGKNLALALCEEGNDITVIDKEISKIESLCNQNDIIGVVGNGADSEVLKEAGIGNTDLLIAVTGSDELNLLACLIAKKTGNCNTIARMRKPEYFKQLDLIRKELGLAMVINKEFASAQEVSRVLKYPSAIKVDTFARSRVEIIKYRVASDSRLINLTLANLNAKLKKRVLVCAVERGDEVIIPKGDYVIKEKDVLSIIAPGRAAIDFFKTLGLPVTKIKNIMIVGGGDIAYYLARILLPLGIDVKIIETDLSRCEELCELLPKATIINGDGTDKELLAEEGVDRCDCIAAMTDIDEENVLLSLYAKKIGVKKVITKINKITFDDVVKELDLDTVFYPKNITAENIIRYVRAVRHSENSSNVETIHRLENNAEAIEFVVDENMKHLNTPLQQLQIKDNVLLASIARNGTVIIPSGNDELRAGDSVVVVTTKSGLDDLNDIFKK